ncbi:MAG: hypothetical protein F4X57_04240 [Chloroflexi bacterium]|nr:hypothetical protein [Chloroflexota bacterium]
MPKTVLDPHITGPRVSADQLLMALLICLIPVLMWLGLGAAGIAEFASGDFGASLSALAVAEAAYAVLVTYILTVATGAFEVLVRAGRFFFRDFTLSLTIRLGRLAIRYSRTTSILKALPPEITHGAADAPLSRNRFLQTPRILVHRWLASTSPHLIFQ